LREKESIVVVYVLLLERPWQGFSFSAVYASYEEARYAWSEVMGTGEYSDYDILEETVQGLEDILKARVSTQVVDSEE
jgi:hypothetical protein